jgi:2-polyprenyl-3-methyl-5-hydroxy-6-metoxy-1,4-benzoquinol methylase
VIAKLGHRVTGIDLSPSMISLARTKAANRGVQVEFRVMNATSPELPPRQFDAIVCRHLLWTLREPGQVLRRWAGLLKETGRLVLIEGYWESGAGLRAEEIVKILPPSFTVYSLENLSEDASLWGKAVDDERYAIIADKNR